MARFAEVPSAPCTSSSESWAACQPVLAVMWTRTKRAWAAGKPTVTVLPAPGLKEYVAEFLRVVKLVPSALPWTESVWFRLSQPMRQLQDDLVDAGARPEIGLHPLRQVRPGALPVRALVAVGDVPGAVLRQRAAAAAAGSPRAMLGPPAAWAVMRGPPSASRLVAITALMLRDLQLCVLMSPRSRPGAQGLRGTARRGPGGGPATAVAGPRRQGAWGAGDGVRGC